MNNPPFYFNPSKDTQAIPSEKTSQAAMETQQGEQDSKKKKCSPATEAPSIVFVHGFKPGPEATSGLLPYKPTKGDGSGFNCTDYWGDAKTFLSEHGLGGDLRTLKYYNGDRECDNGAKTRYSSDLHDPLYKSLCTDYHAGPEGTNWEGTKEMALARLLLFTTLALQ